MSAPFRIERTAAAVDLDGIQEIDRASFSSPWTRAMYEEELRRPGVSCLIVLRTASTPVAGYCSYRLVADELQVNNVAVRPEHRGQGFGRALVEAALRHAWVAGARVAVLEVRRSNLAAQRLYAGLGFTQIGERPRSYSVPEEDALILQADVRFLGPDPTA